MSKTHKSEGKSSKKKGSGVDGKKNLESHDKRDHTLLPKKKKKFKKGDKKEHSLLNKKKHKLVIPEVFMKSNGVNNEKPLKVKKKDKKKLSLKGSTKIPKSLLTKPLSPLEPSPVYPCGVCGKEVNDNDEAILCEAGCTFWYHRHCSGMTNEAYSMLTNEDNAEWVCDKCIATRSVPLTKPKTL